MIIEKMIKSDRHYTGTLIHPAIADLVGWVARFHTQHFQILKKCDRAL